MERPVALNREREHQPADHDGGADESREQQSAEAQLIPRLILRQDGEHQRDEEREHDEQQEMARHHFRPRAMS